MAHDIFVEYYELTLKTRNKVQKEGTPLPPLDHVEVIKAFQLLEKHKKSIIGNLYKYSNNQYATALEHIKIELGNDNKQKVNFVISYYDATAPHRTLKNVTNGLENVQERQDDEAVKHLVHCVIREDKKLIAEIGIERVSGCPASRISKTLNYIFKDLAKIAPNSERIFQVTNHSGAKNIDGSDDIKKFFIKPSIYPIAGEELKKAIRNGKLNTIELHGQRKVALDDPLNRLNPTSKGSLSFKPNPMQPNDTVIEYLKSVIQTALDNKQGLKDPKTFAIIENEDTGSTQKVELSLTNDLNTAFVLRRKFDPTKGRIAQPDNTKVNNEYLKEIWRKFP